MQKPKIPDSVRKEIHNRIKNGVDISDLIANYSIKGEDLTSSIIKTFNRVGEDISNLNLTNAVIGADNTETHVSRAIARNCCFKNTKVLGKLVAKKADFQGTNFAGAYVPVFDYRFANMKNCVFCGTAFTVSTNYSYGSKFDDKFFMDLAKMWNLTITVNKEVPEEDI